jgi:hypothetical protein
MAKPLPISVEIGDDEPVTLAEACRLFFGGRISPSALRTEAAKGRLVITQIARKDFVTRRAIEEMKERCRVPVSRPVSGSEPKQSVASSGNPGSSRTEAAISAQDALSIRLTKRLALSQNTPPANSGRNSEVVPLRSR